MNKKLKKTKKVADTGLIGDVTGLHGDVSGGLIGNVTGLHGDVSGGLSGYVTGLCGDATGFFEDDGYRATRIDADVYPINSNLSARYEHAQGIVLSIADAKKLEIPEDITE